VNFNPYKEMAEAYYRYYAEVFRQDEALKLAQCMEIMKERGYTIGTTN
jgi:hypothetical protein